MDKMGSTEKAKIKGVPSSPRDGTAIELVGLQASVLRFLEKCPEYPHKSVERKNLNSNTVFNWTFKEWAERVEKNFEPCFFVSETDNSPLVHKKNIYKDTVSRKIVIPSRRYLPNLISVRRNQKIRRLPTEM